MSDDRRKDELKIIHVAKRQLGLDDATYRDVLWVVGKVRSAADMDGYGRQRLIDHFKARGFTTTPGKKRKRAPGAPRRDRVKLMSKVEALLADMKLEWAYADGIAKRMFKIDSVRFCNGEQLHKIVAALVYQQRRRQETDHA